MTGVLGASRTTMGGVNNAREQEAALRKRAAALENRLERRYVRHNEAATHNRALRGQIDDLRCERVALAGVDAGLARDLARLTRDIADTINAAGEVCLFGGCGGGGGGYTGNAC